MPSMTVSYSRIPGTAAALGRAGPHTLVADRAEGVAGGLGLGFNGGQLLALALGGCFCNDLQYSAHEQGVEIADLELSIQLDLDNAAPGAPLVARHAAMTVRCTLAGGADPAPVVAAAKARCTVAHSLRAGFEVTIA